MSYIDRGFSLAAELAKESTCPNFKVGAVLMRRNQVVSEGHNYHRKSHPRSTTIWNGIHAEFDCLRGLDLSDAIGTTLFVTRVTNGGAISMSKPCNECWKLIQKFQIRVVYYTDYNGNILKQYANR